jgi:alpha-glucosidase (family GH31 glycosyl hydrolase)
LKLYILAAAAVARAAAGQFVDCSPDPVHHQQVTLHCRDGAAVLLQFYGPDVLRVRASLDGAFPESLTVRWGFVRASGPPVAVRTRRAGEALIVETPALRTQVALDDFRLTVADRAGRVFFSESAPVAANSPAGAVQRVALAPGERFYGLGFQRKALDLRGQKLQWWRAFRSNEATVPFFLSSRGYGYYSNNTYRHVFDFTGADSFTIANDGGRQDYFVLPGPSFRHILDRYTWLTGRPMLAPRWALGVGYQSRYLEEQAGVLATARGFRREDLPLDWIGLEPGWEDVPYAMKWNWSPKRFPDPDSMIRDLAALGVKMGLWESGEAPKTGYTNEAVRRQWYRPRIDAAIRKGVKFFKQDDPYPRMISSQEMLPPEMNASLGGSGVFSAAELNNTTNSLYSQTAMSEYRRVTGERAMIMFNGYNSSISSQRWPFTWEADFPLGVGALSASFSGHSLVSTRDRNEAPDGIHLGYLAPFCYLESWAYYKEPWLYSEPLLEMNRFYAKLRYRLIPYLYSSARQSVESGLPLMRPMALAFEGDPAAETIASQFLLGDWLLVGSATARLTSGAELLTPEAAKSATSARPRIYLPKGRWYDFWTGQAVESGGEWRDAEWPRRAGGPLWVRGGAIVPMGPVVAWADQEPLEVVRLDVYPAGASRYSLYEDDGRTYDYEKGAFATTAVGCVERTGGLAISIGARKGSYAGMPRRGYLVSIHTPFVPSSVTVGGRRLPPAPGKDDLLYVAARRGWWYDGAERVLWIKSAAGWRYDYDARGAGKDPDRDTVYWAPDAPAGDGAAEIAVALTAKRGEAPPPAPPATGIAIAAEHRVLIADAVSATTLTVRTRPGVARVRLEAEGAGVLGCGARVCDLTVTQGAASTTLTSTLAPGAIRVRAMAEGLPPAETTVECARGVLALKASPPERIKLNSDGAWLPLRVTLYAAVKVRGETVKSSSTPLLLHVTGGAGKTPDDRRASAVEGSATFADVFFEKPPRYVMHVSGPGVEPASIPIY